MRPGECLEAYLATVLPFSMRFVLPSDQPAWQGHMARLLQGSVNTMSQGSCLVGRALMCIDESLSGLAY